MLQVRSMLRNATLAALLVALFGILQGGALAASLDGQSDVPGNGATQTAQSAYQVEARNDPVPTVLNRIREIYNVRLCVEELPEDRKPGRIRARGMLRKLNKLQEQRALHSSEMCRLKVVQELVEKGEGHAFVGWKEYTIQGAYKADTIPELLDLVLTDSPYGWYEENRTYVVIPWRKSRLEYLMTVEVENMTLIDVMKMVAEASPPSASFAYRSTALGGLGNRHADNMAYYFKGIRSMMVPKLKMENAPAIDVLNRAVEAAGGHVTWRLSGTSSTIGFSPLPKQFDIWDTEVAASGE